MEDHISLLTHCKLFDGIVRDELYRLFATINYRTRKYLKNEIIYFEGQQILNLDILFEGTVAARMTDPSGKIIRIEEMEATRLLAPAFLFAGDNRSPVELVTTSMVSVLSIARSSFVQLLREDERVLQNYLKLISNRARFLSEKIKFLSFPTIKGKIALYILKKSMEQGSDQITLEQSQHGLSRLFGVSRPALSRALREMHQDGIISVTGKKLVLRDKQSLKMLTLK